MEDSKYYKHITRTIHEILLDSDNKHSKNSRYCVVAGAENNSYYIKSSADATNDENKSHRVTLREFTKDFQNHLLENGSFKILFQDKKPLYNKFFSDLRNKLYEYTTEEEGNEDDFDPFESSYSKPSIEEFERVIKCLEPLIFSIKHIAKSLPGYDYAPTLMNLHNEAAFKNKSHKEAKEIIEADILALSGNFQYPQGINVKNGFNAYLTNKKYLLEQINDKYFEKVLWSFMRGSLQSQYWNDIADNLPNLRINSSQSDSVLTLSNKPIYCIDIDVDAIIDMSPTILNYHELSKVMDTVHKSVIMHKPESVDSIQFNSSNGKMNIITIGEGLTPDLAIKVAHIYEKMVHEYNSENVLKEMKQSDEVDEKNQNYLNKVAETLWMSMELENSSLSVNGNKKKLKL
jgi:hypothetical protein